MLKTLELQEFLVSPTAIDLLPKSSIQSKLKNLTKNKGISSISSLENDNDESTRYLASRWALKEAMVKATKNRSLFYPGMYLDKSKGIDQIYL